MKTDWSMVNNFKEKEFSRPGMLSSALIYNVDNLRDFLGKSIHIHCDYEERATGGYHPVGMALDIHADDTHWFDLFLAASRFDMFNGIGCYPSWNSPGIHIDIRPKIHMYERDARWLCSSAGVYTKLSADNIKKYL